MSERIFHFARRAGGRPLCLRRGTSSREGMASGPELSDPRDRWCEKCQEGTRRLRFRGESFPELLDAAPRRFSRDELEQRELLIESS